MFHKNVRNTQLQPYWWFFDWLHFTIESVGIPPPPIYMHVFLLLFLPKELGLPVVRLKH